MRVLVRYDSAISQRAKRASSLSLGGASPRIVGMNRSSPRSGRKLIAGRRLPSSRACTSLSSGLAATGFMLTRALQTAVLPARSNAPRSPGRQTSGGHRACTVVSHVNNAIRADYAFPYLESRRDRSIRKQTLSTAQRDRKNHQPERIDQVMFHQRLQKIATSPNM